MPKGSIFPVAPGEAITLDQLPENQDSTADLSG